MYPAHVHIRLQHLTFMCKEMPKFQHLLFQEQKNNYFHEVYSSRTFKTFFQAYVKLVHWDSGGTILGN